MAIFMHPTPPQITLAGVLGALADPTRLAMIQAMMDQTECSCKRATPCPVIAKSTLSHHFRILREAGLILTTKKGVEHRHTVRTEELDALFPGLLGHILQCAPSLPRAPSPINKGNVSS